MRRANPSAHFRGTAQRYRLRRLGRLASEDEMPRRSGIAGRMPRLTIVLSVLATVLFGVLWKLDLVPNPQSAITDLPGQPLELIEFDRFSARWERDQLGERLSVSLRLRTNQTEGLPCFVFVVARNDSVTPRLWSIWPAQPPGPAISVGGHFHGGAPDKGYPVALERGWTRITATMPETTTTLFDTVVVYVVSEQGRVLLSRPFRV